MTMDYSFGKEILEKIIDSNNFTVGGGASSALSGAMGAGMISMVSRLSIKKDYGLEDEEYKKISDLADQLAQKLINGSKKDEEAFLMIKNGYSLPKSTEEEKNISREKIQEAAIQAALVPKDNGYLCRDAYDLGKKLKNNSNPNAESDLQIAIMFSELAIKGCILNIEANLSMIKDEKIRNMFLQNIEELKKSL